MDSCDACGRRPPDTATLAHYRGWVSGRTRTGDCVTWCPECAGSGAAARGITVSDGRWYATRWAAYREYTRTHGMAGTPDFATWQQAHTIGGVA